MFVPKPVAERANAFVMAQGDRVPRFTPGVGWVAKESGNIVRFVSSTPTKPGRRIGAVGQALEEAKAKKRAKRIARQKAREAAQRKRAYRKADKTAQKTAQAFKSLSTSSTQAAAAMHRIAQAGKKVSQ